MSKYPAAAWMEDSTCFKCHIEFGHIFSTRHHCRCCGHSFCGTCSAWNVVIDHLENTPTVDFSQPQRVCNMCYTGVLIDKLNRTTEGSKEYESLRFQLDGPKGEVRLRYTGEVGDEYPDGGRARRLVTHMEGDLVERFHPDIGTMCEQFSWAVNQFSSRRCFGWRNRLGEEERKVVIERNGEEIEKIHKIPIQSDYQWMTYHEAGDMVRKFTSSLSELNVQKDEVFAIYMDTCYQWMIAANACWQSSMRLATVYSSLGEEALVFALNQTKSAVVMTDATLLKKLLTAASNDAVPNLRAAVYRGSLTPEQLEEIAQIHPGVSLHSFQDMIANDSQVGSKNTPPSPADVACVMFTSGSTGNPKGVMLTHKNLVAVSASVNAVGKVTGDQIQPDDVYVAYLPLAHILELLVEFNVLASGGSVGYSSTTTLMDDASVNEAKQPSGDLGALRPTIMTAVPLILDRIRKGVTKKVNAAPFIRRTLFHHAYASKRTAYYRSQESPTWDSVVFQKIKDRMGGRMRIIYSGGAPLSAETQEFMNIVLCCPVGQGYGSTETTGAVCVTKPLDTVSGRVGGPTPACEIRLADVADMGYTKDDRDPVTHLRLPRGEICVRGSMVTDGYFNLAEKSAEVFQDGWFKTGDIGQWELDGSLRIIDRKKDLIKLSGGEYIALGKLEAVYKSSYFVENILVYGDGFELSPVCIVLPNMDHLKEWAAANTDMTDVHDHTALVSHPAVVKAVKADLATVGKQAKLKRFEQVTGVHITADEWTPQCGLLTEAMKLKRNPLNHKYMDVMKALYPKK